MIEIEFKSDLLNETSKKIFLRRTQLIILAVKFGCDTQKDHSNCNNRNLYLSNAAINIDDGI